MSLNTTSTMAAVSPGAKCPVTGGDERFMFDGWVATSVKSHSGRRQLSAAGSMLNHPLASLRYQSCSRANRG